MAWVAEETFDSYSDGDLNGNNGGSGWSAAWVAGVAYDVQGTTTFNGSSKAVTGVNANQNATRTLTSSVASGTLYVAMRNSTGSGDFQFDLKVSAVNVIRLSLRDDSGTYKCMVFGSSTTTIINPADTSIFYLFEIILNGNDTIDIRYHNGTSWSSYTTGIAYNGSGNIDQIGINSGISQTIFIDYISPTNPIVSGPANLATRDTVAKANLATIDTTSFSSIATVDTIA